MGFRRAAKVDMNQPQIVKELRALGYKVDIVSPLKKLYDLVVTGRMTESNDIRTVRVELKSQGGTLTPDESDYHNSDPYPETLLIAFSTEEIITWFNSSISNSSFNGVVISASVDVVNTEPTRTTPLFITSNKKGKAVTRKSTTPATLYSSITMNTLTGSLTQDRGGKGSGKSNVTGTAKKK